MRISVVIATYNRAALLQATLDSFQHQPFEPGDELIVVDNGSTDTTAEVIARAGERIDVPLVYLREPTPGKTPALIAGLAAARGDVLALTDDDVLVGEDWIAGIRRVFADPSVALVGGRVDPRWERPAPSWLRVEQGDQYGPMCAPLALLHYGEAQDLGQRTAVGANLIVRRAVLETLGGIAPHLGRQRGTLLSGEDHDLCQRAVAAGYRCEYRPELRVHHWVPAARMRLRYFLRWYFWLGVTNAVMEGPGVALPDGSPAPIPRYLVRRLAGGVVSAALATLAGRSADAAKNAMNAAFAAGYLTRRIKDRRGRAAARHRGNQGLSGARG